MKLWNAQLGLHSCSVGQPAGNERKWSRQAENWRESAQCRTVRKRHTQGTAGSLRTSESYSFPTYNSLFPLPPSKSWLTWKWRHHTLLHLCYLPHGCHLLNSNHPPSLALAAGSTAPPWLVTIQHSGPLCFSSLILINIFYSASIVYFGDLFLTFAQAPKPKHLMFWVSPSIFQVVHSSHYHTCPILVRSPVSWLYHSLLSSHNFSFPNAQSTCHRPGHKPLPGTRPPLPYPSHILPDKPQTQGSPTLLETRDAYSPISSTP